MRNNTGDFACLADPCYVEKCRVQNRRGRGQGIASCEWVRGVGRCLVWTLGPSVVIYMYLPSFVFDQNTWNSFKGGQKDSHVTRERGCGDNQETQISVLFLRNLQGSVILFANVHAQVSVVWIMMCS